MNDTSTQQQISEDAVSSPIVPPALPFNMAGNDIGIVIVHGYGGSIADYRVLAQFLNADGYSIFGIRLAGHGQGQEALRHSTLATWQSSVTQGVTLARQTCRQVFVLGSSFGGVLCLDFAANNRNIAGMILVNTALSYSGAGVFQGLVLRIMKLFTPDYPKKGLTEEEREIAARIGSSSAWPIDGILATSRFARNIVVPKLPSITVPTLIMRSNNDPVVGTKNSERLANLLGSTSKELITIPVSTHRPFRHPEATAFMGVQINQFIKQVLAKS
jgi:carboxylesterase